MAYCVHCGVKLGESEKRCPLCNTAVIDPAQPHDPSVPRAYPVRTPGQQLKRNKRFLLLLFALLLLAPALLCLMIDLLLGSGVTWSIYPSGALALLYIAVAVPILTPKLWDIASLAADFVALSGYLFLVEQVVDSRPWFFPVVLPSLGLAVLLLALVALACHRGWLNKLSCLAAICMAIGVECLGIEMILSNFVLDYITFNWSPYVAAPCIFIALVLFFINGNRAVREEVRRRVHF
ncbi:MAG: hypothetical protein IJE17_10725 [Clostridia bacterium]|nr:hypothetical protein [Clostridia bacterium]